MAPSAGETLIVLGQDNSCNDGWLGVSLYARNLAGNPNAAPPPVDLEAEKRHGEFLQAQIAAGTIRAAHDISDGGLAVAVAEMCIAGRTGASISTPSDGNLHGWAFGEDQARYVVSTDDADTLLKAAAGAGVPAAAIGSTQSGGELKFGDEAAISVKRLHTLVEGTIPALMGNG